MPLFIKAIDPELQVLGATQQFVFNQNIGSIQFDNIFVPTANIPVQNNFETRNNALSGYRWIHKSSATSTIGSLTLQSFVNAQTTGINLFSLNEDNTCTFSIPVLVPTPTNPANAANKQYVDALILPPAQIAGYPNNAGVFLRGDGTWSSNFTTNVAVYELAINNTNPASTATGLVTYNNGNTSAAFGFNNSTNEAYVWAYGTGTLKFGTNATERMKIMADGTLNITTALVDFEININNTNPAAYANGIALLKNGVLSAEFGFNNSTSEAYAWAYGNNTLKFGTNGTQRMKIEANGNIGMGPAFVPDQILSVNGNASKVGGGSWATYSDARIKEVLGDYTSGLKEILQLIPKKYQYNELSGYAATELSIERVGLIAQEIEAIIPECITQFKNKQFEDLRVYDSSAILYMLINAVKELNTKILSLEKRLVN